MTHVPTFSVYDTHRDVYIEYTGGCAYFTEGQLVALSGLWGDKYCEPLVVFKNDNTGVPITTDWYNIEYFQRD